MKVDMSPTAIENRLKLVGELTRVCLLLRRRTRGKTQQNTPANSPKQLTTKII